MTLRVVLDTNIVLSALLFRAGRLSWTRLAWQSGLIKPVVCRETAAELMRVLTYPKFKLTPEDRDELLADFLPWAEVVTVPDELPKIPPCRDPNDQIFLHLAHTAKVDVLATGDADLLTLRDNFQPPIVTADGLKSLVDNELPSIDSDRQSPLPPGG